MRALAAVAFTFSTLAGSPGTVVNSQDGHGTSAQFDAPRGVAVDRAGTVYVADTTNNTIRRISPSGEVVTLAGTPGQGGIRQRRRCRGAVQRALWHRRGRCRRRLRCRCLQQRHSQGHGRGVVSTLAGGGVAGSSDGTGTAARLDEPRGVALDVNGTIYVADYDNHLIRKITAVGRRDDPRRPGGPTGQRRWCGHGSVVPRPDGDCRKCRWHRLRGRHRQSCDPPHHRRRRRDDVDSSLARLREPRGIAVDATGAITVADYGSHTIRSIATSGTVSTLAGTVGSPGTTRWRRPAARFHFPSGLAVTSAGVIYVADTDNDTIRAIAAGRDRHHRRGSGRPHQQRRRPGRRGPLRRSVLRRGRCRWRRLRCRQRGPRDPADHAGRRGDHLRRFAGSYGSADGTGAAARFYSPFGVAVDAAGNVYVADSFNSTVRKIAPAAS